MMVMKKILTDILTTIVVFILLTLSANALKLEENNTYSGTIKDNHRNNIPLPPGDWLLTEINHLVKKSRKEIPISSKMYLRLFEKAKLN